MGWLVGIAIAVAIGIALAPFLGQIVVLIAIGVGAVFFCV